MEFPDLPNPIRPRYTSDGISTNIVLAENEDVTLRVGDQEAHGEASVELKWYPSTRIIIDAEFADSEAFSVMYAAFDSAATMTFLSRNATVDVLITEISNTQARFLANEPIIYDSGSDLVRVVFCVPNFWNYRGDNIGYEIEGGYRMWRGRIELTFEPWRVTIDAVEGIRDLDQRLWREGGFAITHGGELVRLDGATFSAQEAGEVLKALGLFLSFTRGFVVPTLLPAGFSVDGEQVWEEWHASIVDSAQHVLSWFDRHQCQSLSVVFEGFMTRWNDEVWQRRIQSVISMYTLSNRQVGRTDGSVMFAQATLELLCWRFLVEEGPYLTLQGFQNLNASQKIRLLLAQCQIPVDIPADLGALASLPNLRPQDGPTALTRVRNRIVHPPTNPSQELINIDQIFEAWLLSQWYTELILLRFFGYEGEYVNRVDRQRQWAGDVELVPWA